jgi:hypothetical protein
MTRRKFEKGMRVQVTHPTAPVKFKDRIGTIKAKQPYEGYVVAFDDNPDVVESVRSYFIEPLTLDRVIPAPLEYDSHGIEKRRCPRYGADCVVVIEFHARRIVGQCVDYNEHGFGAIIEQPLTLGWIVTVEFPLKDRKPVRVEARAVYEKDQRYGFEFVFPDKNKQELIADFFTEHLQDECR